MPEDKPVDTRPFLTIPYWNTPYKPGAQLRDDGTLRPLPPEVLSWLCPGITTTPYQPGHPLAVTVEVRNAGGGDHTSLAMVTVFWADPSTGFLNPQFFGLAQVPIPQRGASVITNPIQGTIPSSAPSHVCLLIKVEHAGDKAGAALDPISDRHWAQRNLQSVVVSSNMPVATQFWAVNPFQHETTFRLVARPLTESQLGIMARTIKAHPTALETVRLRLMTMRDSGKGRDVTPNVMQSITMEGHRQSLFQIEVTQQRDLAPHEFVAWEVVQVHEGDKGEKVIGSLGFVARGSDK